MAQKLDYPFARVAKAMTLEQSDAFWQALQRSGLDQPAALDRMFQQFVEGQGIEWPPTQPKGGKRIGAGRKPKSDGVRSSNNQPPK